MKKFSSIVATFIVMIFLSIATTYASSRVISLQPGWNTLSTPKVLSAITFSNGSGAGLFFYQLGNSTWSSVQANISNIRPLEGFVVNNTNTGTVQVGLDYATNLAPSDMLFQKTLSAGWNFVGISTETSPFTNIGSNAAMSVDFTRTAGGSNLTNAVNSSFSTTSGNANIAQPELGEAYAVFAQSSGVYGGSQDPEYAVYATGNIQVTRNDGLSNQNILAGSQTVTVYGIALSSTGNNSVSIPKISFNISATGAYQNNAFVTLYVSGSAIATKTITGSTIDFNGLNILISNGQTSNIILKADFNDVFSSGAFQVTLNNLGDATAMSTPAGAIFSMVQPIGTLASTTGNDFINKTLLLAGSATQKVASFKVTATNDIIKLKTVFLTGANFDAISNIRLTDSVGTVLTTASSITSTGATFANVDSAVGSSIPMDASRTFYVVADVNSSTDTTGVIVNVAETGSDIIGSNSIVIPIVGGNIPGASHDIARNTFKIIQTTAVSKSLTTNALEFRVFAFGQNQVTLSGITITTSLGAYSNSSATGVISIYTTNNELVGQTIVGTATGTTSTVVPLSNYNIISSGTDTNYVVKVTGFTLNASTNEAWTVALTSLTANTGVNVLDVVNYPKNLETLPLTSVK